jgi:hypothetical protein
MNRPPVGIRACLPSLTISAGKAKKRQARWLNPYGSCPICAGDLDEGEGPIYTVYHEHCLPRCELCRKEIRADLCAAVYRAIGGNGRRSISSPARMLFDEVLRSAVKIQYAGEITGFTVHANGLSLAALRSA